MEDQNAPLKDNKLAVVFLSVLITAVIFLGLGYWAGSLKRNESSLTTATPTSIVKTSPVASIVATKTADNQEAVKGFVDKFEKLNAQSGADAANALLALFTPAESDSEKQFYSNLAGLDAVSPRLKGSATFGYSIKSYQIDSVKQSGSSYTVNLTEVRERGNNADPSSDQRISSPVSRILEITRSADGNFMIDKYISKDIAEENGVEFDKYTGFYCT